jgi:hypothetical protein
MESQYSTRSTMSGDNRDGIFARAAELVRRAFHKKLRLTTRTVEGNGSNESVGDEGSQHKA